MKTTNLILAACIAAATTAGYAQTTPATPAAPATPTNTMMKEGNMAGGHSATQMDQMFVKNATIGGMFEIKTSELATTKSQDQKVKSFAQRMITDHTKANQKLMKIARSKNIMVPQQLDPQHMQMLNDLKTKTGAEFDKAYSQDQVKAHKGAVQLFKKASTQCDDADLKSFAATTLPTLQEHKKMTKDLPGVKDTMKNNKKKNNKMKKTKAGDM